MTPTYREAAAVFWGQAGVYAYDAYDRVRARLYPELPAQLPIVIGLTAYGHCLGLTRGCWEHGPRVTLPPEIFRGTTADGAVRDVPGGARQVDDTLVHELLHVSLVLAGRQQQHDTEDWYRAVRRLSPAVLGRELEVRRGAGRRSVRVPNPKWEPGAGVPKTVVRKRAVEGAVQHADVARWPQAFRPEDYDWGEKIPCPSY